MLIGGGLLIASIFINWPVMGLGLGFAAIYSLLQLTLGVGLGVQGYTLNGLFSGNWSVDGLQSELANSIFFVGVTVFISSVCSAIKYAARSRAVTTTTLSSSASANRVEYISATELNHTNGLGMSKKEFQNLMTDISSNGIQSPIKCIEINGSKYIIDGNHRVMAAKLLNIKTVPVQYVNLPYMGYNTIDEVLWDASNYISFWR